MRLAEVFRTFVDEEASVGFRAYDGSAAGPRDAVATIELRSPAALSYLASSPGQLGLARAYVTGALEVHGDLHSVLHELRTHRRRNPSLRELTGAAATGVRSGLHRPPLPAEESAGGLRRGLWRHSKRRDAAAIAHHYDLSNRFYALLLGPSMAYSCAVFTDGAASLEQAQTEKFDLICRKLDLRPGERLLDFGAGWGGLIMHAAQHYGVRALGITISSEQASWAQQVLAAAGLSGRAEMRLLDYRDLDASGFDAIASVGAMEHVGSGRLAAYFSSLAGRLRAGGRLLNHAISRPSNRERQRTGPFIDRYVFPDGELQGLGTIVGAMHDNGFEVRHAENLREHYAMTLRAWGQNLERNWRRAVAEIGEQRARAWRLYMAASRLGFDLNRLEIHQVLGVRVAEDGRSGMSLRPGWERAGALDTASPHRDRSRTAALA